MVDYSKWDNLDSGDSDSEPDSKGALPAPVANRKNHPVASTKGATKVSGRGDGVLGTRKDASKANLLERVESLRLQGNAAFERGEMGVAMGAYEAQVSLLDGQEDSDCVKAMCAALLNQVSALIRLEKLKDAERRCAKLLDSTDSGDPSVRAFRTRALHFRGFARLRQGQHEGAAADLRGALAAGSAQAEEARALLMEAEAGAAMSSCRDPEEKGRELLRAGDCHQAARHFREAASRARRRVARPGGGSKAVSDLARVLRMEGVAVARTGDASSAEKLLGGALREIRALSKMTGQSSGATAEGEGMLLAALGGLLTQEGRHEEALEDLRRAVSLLEAALESARKQREESGVTRSAALQEALFVVLSSIGSSLLSLGKKRKVDGEGDDGDPRSEGNAEADEAVGVLQKALDLAQPSATVLDGDGCGGAGKDSGAGEEGGRSGDGHNKGVTARVARVLDALSEAHARGEHWELARAAAERSLATWRSLGEKGRAGAAACLLSLGHLDLQLQGVSSGLEGASACWEEAASYLDECPPLSDAAETRLKVAGFYSRVARSDPSRLPTLETRIAKHCAEAARLFGRERDGRSNIARSAESAGDEGGAGPGGILPPVDTGLGAGGPLSKWELALKEALAWEGYAGAVGDDHEEAVKALRRSERLMDEASVCERDEAWTLRRVAVLQNLAMAMARGGDQASAEDRLLAAIESLRELDNVETTHNPSLVQLHKYLAIARRARGDMPGAREALRCVAELGGDGGHDDAEQLNRMLGRNRITAD